MLREQLVADQRIPKAKDKSTEAKKPRALPIPNYSTLVQEVQSSIDERFAKMQEAIGILIEEKLGSKLGVERSDVVC